MYHRYVGTYLWYIPVVQPDAACNGNGNGDVMQRVMEMSLLTGMYHSITHCIASPFPLLYPAACSTLAHFGAGRGGRDGIGCRV